jgi:hypothetical protein
MEHLHRFLYCLTLNFYRSSSLNVISIVDSGVARYMDFIPNAMVPILQYASNWFGISCDISINNYPGRLKSKIFYWISTIDKRFGDMVLLVSSIAMVFLCYFVKSQDWNLSIVFPCRSRNGQKLKILTIQKMEPWTHILCSLRYLFT